MYGFRSKPVMFVTDNVQDTRLITNSVHLPYITDTDPRSCEDLPLYFWASVLETKKNVQ
jgi:hypothetical protein